MQITRLSRISSVRLAADGLTPTVASDFALATVGAADLAWRCGNAVSGESLHKGNTFAGDRTALGFLSFPGDVPYTV